MELNLSRFLRMVVILAIAVAIVWLLYIVRDTLTLIIVSALLAYILDPVASYLEYRGLSRMLATTIIFILIASFLVGMAYYFVPPLIQEIAALQSNLDSGATQQYVNSIKAFLHDNLPFLSGVDIETKINSGLMKLTASFFAVVGNLMSIVTTLVVIPFAVFFLIKDGQRMIKGIVSVVPNRYFEMTLNLIYKIDLQIGGYLRGQFIDAVIVGILSIIALAIIRVEYFVVIGMFGGLANIIPYVGPIVGMAAASTMAMIDGGGAEQVIYIVIAFIFIQLIDNVIIQPLVVAKSVDLHPLTVIFAVIIGGQFFGLLGMLLAVPATGIIKVSGIEIWQAVRKYHLI
jgi:predicted PurR-regulated permease PerM